MEEKVSVIVSVFNEEAVLDTFFEAFFKLSVNFDWDYELIFVNDGSTDSSLEILRNKAEKVKEIKIISFSRNFGHEAAMIAGVDYANGDCMICMDADLQHPLECIFQIVEKFREGYDVINMVRRSNKSAGVLKNITSKAFYKVINFLSKESVMENASDFFAVSRRVANVLRHNYREKSRFLRGYVQNVGFKKTTIEYEAGERVGGASHYSIKKLMRFSISAIVCSSDIPIKLGVYAGIGSAAIGIGMLIYTLFTCKGAPNGYATIVVLICFLFAVMFILIGIIGQYLAVFFAELKDRPIYIVEEKLNIEE